MKKTMIALAVLAAAAGTAQAATSVTLYGTMDLGYTRTTGDVFNPETFETTGATQISQAGAGETSFGVKGEEDLGNGYAAIFQLEGRFDADTGAKTADKTFFDRESTVGLKTPYGTVRLGTSLASMETAVGFVNVGRRNTDVSPYSSYTRVSNAAFYDHSIGAFSFGGHLTTRHSGGSWVNSSGRFTNYENSNGDTISLLPVEGTGIVGTTPKAQYGVYAKYAANNITAAIGYQKDGADVDSSKEIGLGLGYAFKPFAINAGYTTFKDYIGSKINTIQASVSADLTAKDNVSFVFQNSKPNIADSYNGILINQYAIKKTTMGLGYVHSLSKRTSAYANIARVKFADNEGASATAYTWDIAVRHSF